jgi:hypothetical protein
MSGRTVRTSAGTRRLSLALLLVLGTLAGLALAEVVLRVHYVLSYSGRLEDLAARSELPARNSRVKLGEMLRLSPNPRIIYELKPNLDVSFRSVSVRTNEDGWRDAPFLLKKADDVVRIVAIGDSVLFGWAVPASRRYADLLEQMLNRRYPGRSWEIMVFAAPGYNLVMELEVLRSRGLAYQPDAILYGYTSNDSCLPNFVSDWLSVFSATSFLREYLTGLTLENLALVERDDRLIEGSAVSESGEFDELKFCDPATASRQYRDLVGLGPFQSGLEDLARMGAELDIPVVFINHPILEGYPEAVVPEGLIEVDAIRGFAPIEGARFRTRLDPNQHQLSIWDPHPTVAGNALIAKNIFEQLEAAGVWARLADEAGRER